MSAAVAAAAVLRECFIAKEQGSAPKSNSLDLKQNPDPDVLGFSELVGVTIWRKRDQPSLTTVKTLNLDTQTVVGWLGADETETQEGETLVAKLLIGEQVQRRDCLTPPKDIRTVEVSRHLMAQSLQMSSLAIAKMGTGISWAASFQSNFGHHVPCHGIEAWKLSAAWSYNLNLGTNRAFLLSDPSHSPTIQSVLQLLDQLQRLSHLPALVPFLVVDINIEAAGKTLSHEEYAAAQDHLHLQRYLSQERNPKMLYFGAVSRHNNVTHIKALLEAILKMLEQYMIQNLEQRNGMKDEAYADLVSEHEIFRDAVMIRAQEIKSLIAHAQRLVKVSKTQMSSILGLMTIRQQDTSQEIARATKQDGASMKTLAVMTMLFLPSTAVAAVMAIPVFDWNALSVKDVTSSKIWIFFIIAIPLTAITMLAFRYWLRVDIRAEKLRQKESNLGNRIDFD